MPRHARAAIAMKMFRFASNPPVWSEFCRGGSEAWDRVSEERSQRMRSRLAELTAIIMIGDGVLAVIAPKEHIRLWQNGPHGWKKVMRRFERRPGLTRTLGAVEIALGIWLAKTQYRKRKGLLERILD
jgi:hypothetical protein